MWDKSLLDTTKKLQNMSLELQIVPSGQTEQHWPGDLYGFNPFLQTRGLAHLTKAQFNGSGRLHDGQH